jgi:flagellar motor protein MotB
MADSEHHEEGHDEGSHGGGSHGGHSGGGHEEAHEGAPEWLISFADNVALMMGFFVILLAMNMGPKGTPVQGGAPDEVNNENAADIILSIREGFNQPIDMGSDNPSEAWLRKRVVEKASGVGDQDGPKGNKPNLHAPRPTDYNSLGGTVAFDDGSDIINSAARQTATELALRLKDRQWIVELRGHTSPTETLRIAGADTGSRAERTLELSYRRARAVARVLVENGLKWEQIRVSAAGDHERVVPRTYDPKQDRANQRVDIIVTNDLKSGDPYSGSAMSDGPLPGGGK